MEALQSNEFKKLIDSNPQIKSVMQDSGNIQKAQNLLKDPEVAQTISKIMTNPDTLQKAGAMLEGLKQVDTQVQGQLGGGRRRRRKSRRKSRKRRKSTKKRRRRKRGGIRGIGCIGKICTLVKKAVNGDPMPLFENIKATVIVPKGLDSWAWKKKKKAVKYEFDYHARGSKGNTEFAAFAEWWIFEKLKLCCAGDQSNKLMYENQGKYAQMLKSQGLGEWNFTKANRKNDKNEPSPFYNPKDAEKWDWVKNPIPTKEIEDKALTEESGEMAKAAVQGGRKSRRKRRKSRRKTRRSKKKRRKRRN